MTLYKPNENLIQRLLHDFTYHPPFGNQATRYELIRAAFHDLSIWLTLHVPESRELSLALTKMEEAVFWANAAIARKETPHNRPIGDISTPPSPPSTPM